MTNLLAMILVSITTNWTVSTNWVKVGTTYPVPCGKAGYCVYHALTDNQVGTVMSKTVAVIEWKGRKVEVALESVEIAVKPARRGGSSNARSHFPSGSEVK